MKAAEFAKIRRLAYDTFGLDLREGKETLVSARLGKQIRQSGCQSFDQYYRHVVEDSTGKALIHLIDALTTNHTSFFREPAHFDFLRKALLAEWKDRARIEIWSAACSSGEEPYSIAMCLLEELGAAASGKVRILATDISTRVLGAARKGDFAGSYRAKKELRAMIEFRRLNLLEPGPRIGPFPLIFCRNVMIYFDKPTQRRVVERLSACLEPGGWLLTGHAESLTGVDHGLLYVQPAVYRKAPSADREKGKR